jgi:Leucine-rich repeat (LRR) protein
MFMKRKTNMLKLIRLLLVKILTRFSLVGSFLIFIQKCNCNNSCLVINKTSNHINIEKISIICENLDSETLRKEFMQKLRRLNEIDQLIIANNKLDESLSLDLIENLNITSLEIRNNRLKFLNSMTFSKIKELKYLALYEPTLRIIEEGLFLPLKNCLLRLELKSINLNNESLEKFSKQINDLISLDELKLNNNAIKEIGPNWLEKLSKLTSLSLSFNKISKLYNNSFDSFTRLKKLYLKSNKINGKLDQEPFKILNETLNRLVLSDNEINELPDKFVFFRNLNYLDLSSNKLISIGSLTFEKLINLYTLNLSYNLIEYIQSNAFDSLANLYNLFLSNNRIRQLPCINYLNSLILIDLSNQNQSHIRIDNYQFQRNLAPELPLTIDLSQNNFITFREKAFCSKNYLDPLIDSLKLSADLFDRLVKSNYCILTQFSNSLNQSTKIELELNQNEHLCDCNFLVFLKQYRLELLNYKCKEANRTIDIKSKILDMSSSCQEQQLNDICISELKYSCSLVFSSGSKIDLFIFVWLNLINAAIILINS